MRLETSILLLALLLAPSAAWPGGTASPNDDILIVPQDASPFQFLEQDLVANDGPGAGISSHTATSRGNLVRTGELFTYTPSPELGSAGMDSFSYALDSGARALVFLVAETSAVPQFAADLDLEIHSGPGTVVLRQGTLGNGSFPLGKGAEARLAVDETADGGYLKTFLHTDAHAGPSGSGGKIGAELDPDGFWMPDGEARIATASIDGELELELTMTDGGSGCQVSARAWPREGAPVALPPVTLGTGPQSIAVRWWPESPVGALNGGLSLELGQRVVASAFGLDGRDIYHDTEIEVRFGAMEAEGGRGSLRLADLRYWETVDGPPALTPIFADGVESGDTGLWTGTVGDLSVSSAAAIHGAWGLEVPVTFPAYLIDDSPAEERHLRARFNLDASSLNLAGGQAVTVLTGDDQTVRLFSIDLRRQPDGLELCGTASSNGGSIIEVGCAAIDATTYSVALQWWAAANAEAQGGLTIRLRDPELTHPGSVWVGSVYDLQNYGQSLREIRFGAINAGAGATGELHLDDFESWR